MYFGRRTKNYIISGILVFVLYSAIWAIPAPRSSVNYARPFADEEMDDSFVLDNEVLVHPTMTADKFSISTIVDTLDYELPLLPPDTGLKVKPKQPSDNPLDEDRDSSPFGLKDPQGTGPRIEYPLSSRYGKSEREFLSADCRLEVAEKYSDCNDNPVNTALLR